MNPGTVAAFGVAAVFALGDWVSRARDASSAVWRRVEYVCKPATLLALIVAAVAIDPAAGADARQRWFVAALVFSLAGDVLLMLPREQFVGGLSAFLVGHLCYLAGFWTRRAVAGSAARRPWSWPASIIGALGRRILPGGAAADRARSSARWPRTWP